MGVCLTTATAAAQVAAIADGIGPSTGQTKAACVQAARGAGLFVRSYTFLSNTAQYQTYYNLGVDGVFANVADIAEGVRDQVFPVPEPGTASMLVAGLLGLAGVLARRRPG